MAGRIHRCYRARATLFVLTLAALLVGVAHPAPRAVAIPQAVSIANFAFSPTPLTVSVGDTVTWTNTDTAAHDATADDRTWASGTLSTGQSFSYTFTRPGTYTYLCTIHPFMKGTVVVNDTGGVSGSATSLPAPAAAAPASGAAGATLPAQVPAAQGGYSPSFMLGGMVSSPQTYTLTDLQALPAETISVQFQSGAGLQQHTYTGVLLNDLLTAAVPQFDPARKNDKLDWYVQVTGSDGYQALVAWGEFDPGWEAKQVLVAYAADGQPLGDAEGMARLVVPGDSSGGRYVSNITAITLQRARQ